MSDGIKLTINSVDAITTGGNSHVVTAYYLPDVTLQRKNNKLSSIDMNYVKEYDKSDPSIRMRSYFNFKGC